MKKVFLLLCLTTLFNLAYSQTTYYSLPGQTTFNNLSGWNSSPDGSGTAPTALNTTDNFIVTNNAVIASLGTNISVNNLNVTNGSLLVNNSLAVNNLVVDGGTITSSDASARTISTKGNFIVSSGVFQPGTGASTITMIGTAAATINFTGGNVTLGNLTIGASSASSKIVTLLSNISIPASRILTINGRLNADLFTISGSGALNIAGGILATAQPAGGFGATCTLSGTKTFTYAFTYTSRLEYNASGNQVIDAATHPLGLGIGCSGSGTKTLNGNIGPISGQSGVTSSASVSSAIFVVAAGSNFADGGYTLNLNTSYSHIWIEGGYISTGNGGLIFGTTPYGSTITAVDGTNFGDLTFGFNTVTNYFNVQHPTAGIANISFRNITFGSASGNCGKLNLSYSGSTTNITVTGNINIAYTGSSAITLFDGATSKTTNIYLQGNINSSSTSTTQYLAGTTGTNIFHLNGSAAQSLIFGGNANILPAAVNLKVNNSNGITLGNTTTHTISVSGILEMVNGSITLGSAYTLNYNSGSTLKYTGTSAQVTGGEVAASMTNAALNISNTEGVTLNKAVTLGSLLLNSGSLNNGGNLLTVNGTAIFNLNYISGTGGFTAGSASVLNIASPDGINSGTASGNIRVAGTRTFTSGVSYIFNAISAQVTGDGCSGITTGSLTINNTNGVTLSAPLTVGTVTLTAGILHTTDANLLTSTSTSNSFGTLSGTNYIEGPFARTVANTFASNLKFPLGKTTAFNPFEILGTSLSGTGTITFKAEVFNENASGTAGSGMATVSSSRYWALSSIPGAVTVNSISVKLTEAGLTSGISKIGQSNSVTGAYVLRGGTVLSDSITSTRGIDVSTLSTGTYFLTGTASALVGPTYTVGVSGADYTSLSAFNQDLNDHPVNADLTILLNNDYTSSNETFPISFPQFISQGGTHTITIRPNAGVTALQIAGSNATAILDFNGGDHYVLDGRSLNSETGDLTIENTASASSSVSTVRFINDASSNIVRYCTLKGLNTSNSTGVVLFSTTTGTTGNDDNEISNNDIDGKAGSVCTITSYGTTTTAALYNSGNKILNNNIHDYFSAGTASNAGIRLKGSTDWTISGNKLYQTASRTFTGSAYHYGIWVDNIGSGYTINNNIIGFANASGTGTYTMAGTAAIKFYAIYLEQSTAVVSEVQGNLVSNLAMNTSYSGSTTIFNGIYINANANVGNTAGNIIGSTAVNGSITVTSSVSNGIVAGISCGSIGNVNISNNIISGINALGTASSIGENLSGIYISASAANLTVNNNIIGGTLSNSLKSGSTAATSTGSTVIYGIFNTAIAASGITVYQGNTISNLLSEGTGSSSQCMGIRCNAGTNIIVSNNISGIQGNGSKTGYASGEVVVAGIFAAGGNNNSITQNNISGLTAGNAGAIQTVVAGIDITACTPNTTNPIISKNKISDLYNYSTGSSLTTPPVVCGIFTGTFTTNPAIISNNMISLGANDNIKYIGIWDAMQSSVALKVYYNSVYLTGTGGTFPTYCFYRGINNTTTVATPVDIKNNIFYNARTNGSHYAIGNDGTSAYSGWVNCDYNDYFTSAGVDGIIGEWGGSTGAGTLAQWKNSSSADAHSINSNPLFHSFTNLHVIPSSSVNNAGTAVTVTTDFDGEVRDAVNPDMGADEYETQSAYNSGILTNPTGGIDNNVITGIGSVTVNPTTSLTGTINGFFFNSGRTGILPGVVNSSYYYWVLTSDISSFNANVKFHFSTIVASGGVSDFNTLKLFKRDGAGSAWVEYTDVTRTALYIQANNVTGFSEWSFGGSDDNSLPVELTSFTAECRGRTVYLNWVTKTELNSSSFIIERSTDGKLWNNIGNVKAAVNSSAPINYTYTDSKLNTGMYSYRLKMIDINGSFKLSSVVYAEIELPKSFSLSQNYPNPFNPSTRIDYQLPVDARVTIDIYSISGEKVFQLVNKDQNAGYYVVDVNSFSNGHNLASGIYIYRISAVNKQNGSSFNSSKKMMLLK